MPKPRLKPPLDALEGDIIDTLLAGLHEWRSDLNYPESHSDMQGCVRALLREFEVTRRPIGLATLPTWCELCGGTGRVLALKDGDPRVQQRMTCPGCAKGTEWPARTVRHNGSG